MGTEYRWATLGCGVIGNELAQAMRKMGKNLYSVGNRTHSKAVKFADKYAIGKVYGNPDEIFYDENVDIIYISTPHNLHIDALLKALNNRFFNKNLAGGALLDIGVYALSLVRWFMSETPDQITAQVKYAPTGVDEQAGILLMNPKQEMATVTLSLHAKQPKRATVVFDRGYIEIYEYPRAFRAAITYTADGHTEIIEDGDTADALLYEVQDMEDAVSGRENVMHLDYTIDVMNIMTSIRKKWGMQYPEEIGGV